MFLCVVEVIRRRLEGTNCCQTTQLGKSSCCSRIKKLLGNFKKCGDSSELGHEKESSMRSSISSCKAVVIRYMSMVLRDAVGGTRFDRCKGWYMCVKSS